MKRTSPLWGSISILIGVVIAILSLLRDTWMTVALITVSRRGACGLFSPSLFPPGSPIARIGVVSASPVTGRKPLRILLTAAWGWYFCAM